MVGVGCGGLAGREGEVGEATLPFLSYGISPLLPLPPPPTHEQRDAALVGHQRERKRESRQDMKQNRYRQTDGDEDRERVGGGAKGGMEDLVCVCFFFYAMRLLRAWEGRKVAIAYYDVSSLSSSSSPFSPPSPHAKTCTHSHNIYILLSYQQ